MGGGGYLTTRGGLMSLKRFVVAWALVGAVLVAGSSSPVRAEDKNANAVLDKAIKALGGEEKLGNIKAMSWKSKGTITFGGDDNNFTGETIVQGLDHFRSTFEGEFMGNKVKGATVLAGDKGWRKFADMGSAIEKEGLANEKRNLYLQIVPVTIVPLKGKGFKVEAGGEEKVGGKAASVLKVTGPDGKDFKLFFDKESGLPVKLVAKVRGFMGEEFTQETTYGGYKDFGGIKKATKNESKRDGEKFLKAEVTEFKVLDKVPPKTFAEPE
jgi:hypothetical protein